jgi:predicted nucleic acid-binding protein
LYIHTARETGSTLVSSDQKLLNAAARECHTKKLLDI